MKFEGGLNFMSIGSNNNKLRLLGVSWMLGIELMNYFI